ncbi:MAG: putative membrane protein [Polaribacter sp.]|jgi:uncharacterized membrane protein
MKHNVLLYGFVALLTALYPIVIYYGLNQYGPRALALLLFLVLLVRSFYWKAFKFSEKLFYLLLVGTLCAVAAWFESELMLRYYPVLMNFGIASFFAFSLFTEQPLIERLASLMKTELNPSARCYMRRLTQVWAGLLTVNGIISSYTACCLPLKQWAIYNGVIAYLIFAVFSLGELIVRHYYKKRYPL